MMSQQRTRKIGGAAIEPARGRQSVGKASGDAMSSNVQNKQPNVRSTSKSKLPKSLRYDLENALVSLCDVWFEEIKPHLVRNNIKVHVHGGAGPASGDYQRLPPGAPGCSHLDPGLSAGDCELCRLLFNAANSIESAVSQAASVVPPGLPVASHVAVEASGFPSAKLPRNSLARRTSRPRPHPHLQPQPHPQPHTQPQPQPQHLRNWRTPRLCQTFSILTPRTNPPESKRRTQTAIPQIYRRNQYKRRPKKKDKSTQTPVLRKLEPLSACQEESWRQELVRQELLRQKQNKQDLRGQESYKQEPHKQDLRGQESYKQAPYKQDVRGQMSYKQEPHKKDLRGQEPHKQDLLGQESYKQEPYKQDLRGQEPCKQESYKQDLLGQESYKHELFRQLSKKEQSRLKATTPSCLRCPATTTLCPTHRSRKPSPPIVPLFQEDLINILAEKNDKQLRLLYKSPTRENPSSLNLALAPPPRLPTRSKRAPWR